MSLTKRIQILLAFLVGVPFLMLMGESYRTGRATVLRQMRNDATHTAHLQAANLEATFEAPRAAAEGVARALSADPRMDAATVRSLLRNTLAEVDRAFGLAVALPDGAGPGRPLVPYVFRKGGALTETSLEGEAYDYRNQEWFARPYKDGRPVWTRAYLDRGGGDVPMITFCAPIRREGRVVGVATADVALERMVQDLRQLTPGGGGHVYMVSRDGAVLAHPKLPTLDDPGAATGIPRLGALKPLLERAGADAMSLKDPFTQEQAWLVEVPLPPLAEHRGGAGWSLIVSWPEKVRLQPLADLGKRFLVIYLALGGAALLFLNRSMLDLITRPIARLARQAHRFAEGDFGDLGHPPEDSPELKDLSHAVQTLGRVMKQQRKDGPEGRP